jgi:hypothetical protein
VIEAFGQFVVGGNYVVGFVLFAALIAIQYLVINHGAVRIAEVTARFTLDALPGKQMAIDADLGAGLIDENQARARREHIAREAEFYGAMDGAARFSQRDALATILITAVNIVAGFLVGILYLGIPFQEALRTYTILTVGDGLVTMIPSLLVSVAGAMVATRASSESSLGVDLSRQLLPRSRPLWISSTVMLTLGLIPGLPKFSFFLLAGVAGLLAWRSKGPGTEAERAAAGLAQEKAPTAEPAPQVPKLDDLSVEVGYGLVPLVDQAQGGQLLQQHSHRGCNRSHNQVYDHERQEQDHADLEAGLELRYHVRGYYNPHGQVIRPAGAGFLRQLDKECQILLSGILQHETPQRRDAQFHGAHYVHRSSLERRHGAVIDLYTYGLHYKVGEKQSQADQSLVSGSALCAYGLSQEVEDY